MNRTCLFSCIFFCIFLNNPNTNPEYQFEIESSELNKVQFMASADTIWNVKEIVKLNDPAPGGGKFEEFGDHWFLESGAFVFWARYGDNKRKDWALYNYKNGSTKLILKTFENHNEPDGISKEFHRSIISMINPILVPGQARIHYGGASSKLLYLAAGSGLLTGFDFIYSWDGEELKKIIGEGDKIVLPGNREVIIKNVRLEYITNDNHAVIFFSSEKPNKIKGWFFHDGISLKPFSIVGDELPDLPGIKFIGIVPDNKYQLAIFKFEDTILANLYVDNAPYRQGIFRFTKNKTELIESSKGFNQTVLLGAANGDNFIYSYKETIHYKNGNQVNILENRNELPKSLQSIGQISDYEFTGPDKETIIFLSTSNTRQGIYSCNNTKLSNLYLSKGTVGGGFKETPYHFRSDPKLGCIFIENLWFKVSEDFYTQYLIDASTSDPKLILAPELKTTGTNQFDYSDILVVLNENKLLVKHTPVIRLTGFYELTK